MARTPSREPPKEICLYVVYDYVAFPHLKQYQADPLPLHLKNSEFAGRCFKDRFLIIAHADSEDPKDEAYKIGTLAFILNHKNAGGEFHCELLLLRRISIESTRIVTSPNGNYCTATWKEAPSVEIPIDYWNSPAFQRHLPIFASAYGEVFMIIDNAVSSITRDTRIKENEKLWLLQEGKILIRDGLVLLKMLLSPQQKNFGGVLDRIAHFILEATSILTPERTPPLDLLENIRLLYLQLEVTARFMMTETILIRILPRLRWLISPKFAKNKSVKGRKSGSYQLKYDGIKDRLSEETRAAIEYEISRVGGNGASSQMAEDHLRLLLEMPWGIYTEDEKDLRKIQVRLNESHWGLDKVKDRILEFIAVMQQNPESRPPILCFVGPPGVGKTSLGQAIANALGRKFIRLSLGGMSDESEIKGHRGTYVNAKPGRIIDLLKKAGSANPVFMLDELDKVTTNWRGDPSATLLEVLDPEQNRFFLDNFLDVPFDLSRVLFITTANMFDTIRSALLDRLEIIEIPSYTPQEKLNIAKAHLIPRRKKENGFPVTTPESSVDIVFPDETLMKIIYSHTQEAGVRNLDRVLDKPYRKLAKKLQLEPDVHQGILTIVDPNIQEWCGNPEIIKDFIPDVLPYGVVPVLAVTEAGGLVFMVEVGLKSSRSTRKIAMTGIRASGQNKETVNDIEESFRRAWDALTDVGGILEKDLVNLEKKWGPLFVGGSITGSGIPKDGPSAGISLYLAIYGLLTNQSIKPTKEVSLLAPTGAITKKLGLVEPVGGIRNKLIRAEREGIKRVIIPHQNKRDIEDIPEEVRSKIEIFPIRYMWEALAIAYPDDKKVMAYVKTKSPQI